MSIIQTPGLFAQNFVETLFVLNNYSEHPCYAAAAAGRADAGEGVTMDGIDLGGDSPAQVRLVRPWYFGGCCAGYGGGHVREIELSMCAGW